MNPKVVAAAAALLLTACATAGAPAGVPAVASLQQALPVPVATGQPDLVGALWMDQAFGEIWRIDLPSGAVRKVLATGEHFPAQPALPASGSPLAYMAGERLGAGFTNRFGIAVDAAMVLRAGEALSYQDPALSPDGRILFATQIGIPADAVAKPTSGSSIVQLALSESGTAPSLVVLDAMQPAVSPDGRSLAYITLNVSQPPTVTRSIRVRDLASGAERIVVPDDRFYDVFGPRWLAAGRLVFAALESSPVAALRQQSVVLSAIDGMLGLDIAHAHAWTGDVWAVNVDGTDLVKLTQRQLQAPIPAPSPDGRQLALLTGEGIFIMPVAGGSLRQISPSGGSGGLVWTR